jgi:hypothetical protein
MAGLVYLQLSTGKLPLFEIINKKATRFSGCFFIRIFRNSNNAYDTFN